MNDEQITIHHLSSSRTHRTYSIRFFERRLLSTVTAHNAAVRKWVYDTRCIHGHHFDSLIVGLGVQWRPNRYRGGPDPPVATMQLCVGHRCLIFQVLHAPSVPRALSRFLADSRITFVGVGNRYDQSKLRQHCRLVVGSGKELRRLAGMGNASMETMARVILGYKGVKKPNRIGRSAWDAVELKEEQIQYACVDAYVAFRLGLSLL